MRKLVWNAIASVFSRPNVSAWIIKRAQRTPYSPITSRDGAETYMDRWWLFNPYTKDANDKVGPAKLSWLPSIRVHHIMRADDAEHMHDHPWNARTIVLRGWYIEERPHGDHYRSVYLREQGYTGRVLFNDYHHIDAVAPGGVFTLWFTWKYRGTWGFLVDGVKVPYRKYLGL